MSVRLRAVTYSSTQDASTRARVVSWLERELAPGGFEHVVTGPVSNLQGSLRALRSLRATQNDGSPLLLARSAHPLAQGYVEQSLLRAAQPGVYDIDDGLPFDNGRLPLHGTWWKPLFAKSRLATRAARGADRVIAGNEVLAQWASKHCRDVVVIPTCVRVEDYTQKRDWSLHEDPVIGWMGSPATEPHLWSIAEAIAEARTRVPFRLEIVSAGSLPIPAVLAAFATRIDWTSEVQHTQPSTWDVGIMPLPDLRYERAKCAYKLLQYGASALPAIGSPIGASAPLLESSGAPMPRTHDEWVGAIVDVLTASPRERAELAERIHAVVKREYTFDVWSTAWRLAVGLSPIN